MTLRSSGLTGGNTEQAGGERQVPSARKPSRQRKEPTSLELARWEDDGGAPPPSWLSE